MGCCRWCCPLLAVLLAAAALAVLFVPPPQRLPQPADRRRCAADALPPGGDVRLRAEAEFDVVVYGATGFTGGLVARYLAARPGNFSYALAGRSARKLEALAGSIAAEAGGEPPAALVADAGDLEALRALARRARVLVSAAGPYAKHGSLLVQACAEQGVHYADISGEFTWQRQMIDAFHSVAGRTGTKIVIAAGYDSLPFDLGAALAWEMLDISDPPEVTITAAVLGMRGWYSGGTLQSGMGVVEALRKGEVPEGAKSDPYYLMPGAACPVDTDVSGWGLLPRYDHDVAAVGVPHFMAAVNARVVRRSMALLGRHGVSYKEGMTLGAFADGLRFALPFLWRGALRLVPQPGEGPPEEVQRAGGYEVLIEARDAGSGSRASVALEGRGDPGYAHTARLLAELGLCLADAACHRRGGGGGVLTSASAADALALATRLQAARHEDGGPLLRIRTARTRAGRPGAEGEL